MSLPPTFASLSAFSLPSKLLWFGTQHNSTALNLPSLISELKRSKISLKLSSTIDRALCEAQLPTQILCTFYGYVVDR